MALLALRQHSKHNRTTTAPARWALIVACVLSVHVVVLAVGRAGAFGGAEPARMSLMLQMLDEEQPLDAVSPDNAIRPPAEFLTTISNTDPLENLPLPLAAADARPGRSPTQSSTVAIAPRNFPSEDVAEIGRGEMNFEIKDVPLSAEPLAPPGSRSVTNSETEITGFSSADSINREKGSFAKMLNAMAPPAPREALRLPGKPAYPRACRQGLCRNGQPCEGTSQWQVTVPAAGGKPLKIECLKKMDCELQNASIRKFFADSKFAPTNEDSVYLFPVTMNTHQ